MKFSDYISIYDVLKRDKNKNEDESTEFEEESCVYESITWWCVKQLL